MPSELETERVTVLIDDACQLLRAYLCQCCYGEWLNRGTEGQAAQYEHGLNPEIGRVDGHERQFPVGEREENQAGNHHSSHADAVYQPPADDDAHHRGQCLRQQQHTCLEGAETAQILQVDGEEEYTTKQAERDKHVRDIACPKRSVGKEP